MQKASTRSGARRGGAKNRFFVLLTGITIATCVALTAGLFGGVENAQAATPSQIFAASAPGVAGSLFPSLPASSRGEAVIEKGAAQVSAQLLVATEDPARVGVLFDLAPGWHLYWRNPGQTGIAPRLDFEAAAYSAGEVSWPAPQTFREADGLFTTYGYENRVLLTAPLLRTRNAEVEQSSIRVIASVLVCHTQCVPATFELTTPIKSGLSSAEEEQLQALFEEAERDVPTDLSALGWSGSAHWLNHPPDVDEVAEVRLSLAPCDEEAAQNASASCPAVTLADEQLAFLPLEGDTFEVAPETTAFSPRLSLALSLTRLEAGEARLRGVIPLRDENGRTLHVRVDLPIQGEAQNAAIASGGVSGAGTGASTVEEIATPLAASIGGWLRILFLALLGGLILNGMPCVLPVLAIKVVAVADMAEKDPKEVRLHGLAYTAGVLASMAVLATIVLSLRAAGHAVGWGFQFQEPIFIAAISALLVGFALNLFGVFEIEMGQGRLASVGQESTGLNRSAFEGLLAVILATPCTAPFLGTAVGFAFASSGYGIVTVFLAIGLGLAAPFLLVSFFPSLARFIPRSGPWMLKLRAGLGFSLLGTVVWLLWVLGQSGGADTVVAMVGALLLFSFLLWGFGQLQPLRSAWLGRVSVAAIVCVAFTSFNLINFETAAPLGSASVEESEAHTADKADEEGFRPYSKKAVAEALAAGQPAFVVFTADWCITCKMNEKTVLKRQRVREAFAAGDYALFKADWTRRDDTIRARLADFGRAGVPLYLVYSPETPDEPEVLSELLSQREVVEALEGPKLASRP
ncbi:MAG: protein-disulfide reductase DsbD family protein [Myxococcota bacterium]